MQSRMSCLVVGVLSLLLSNLAGAQGYSWTEIVIPGSTISNAFGLNDKGQTAVTTTDNTSGIYGDGTFTPLPPPPEGISRVIATGINNDGVITGSAYTVTGIEQGFILRGSTYMLFTRPDWDGTEPRAIANSGLITGYSYSTHVFSYAGFIYDADTNTFTDATPPGSDYTIVHGMNKFGRITGHGRESGIPGRGRYGFVWQHGAIAKGKRELLPFLDRLSIDFHTRGRGINDSGIVVGFLSDAAARGDGFVGNDARGYQRLVAPGGEVAGNSTICEGINNFAQVVCFVMDPAGNTLGAFIGSPVEGEGNADSSSHAASTRDIAASSGAAEWTNKSREELVIPAMRLRWRCRSTNEPRLAARGGCV